MNKKKTSGKILKLLIFLTLITVLGTGALYLIHHNSASGTQDRELADITPKPLDILPEETPSPEQSEPTPTPTPEPTPEPEPEVRTVTLMALGDDLMHMGVVNTGRQADGSYDYGFLFNNITDFLEKADIKVINQETILGGNDLGFSGFPLFNSPTEVGDGIAAAGFNVVLHASNHAADKGLSGLQNCVSFWEQYPDVLMVGIQSEPRDTEEKQIPILTIGDTTFAILNYTYSPNMEVLPSYLWGRLDMLCDYDRTSGAISFTKLNPEVTEDIRAARELADVVIVFPHWGTEYRTKPSSYQKNFAMEMVEAGADLIIGTHPHVVQPVEWIEAENGNRALCYYSLGNYVSTQKDPITMLEAMAWVTFEITEEGVSIRDDLTGVIPLVCQVNSNPTRIEDIYLFENYTAEQADAHGIKTYGHAALTMPDLQSWVDEIFGDTVISASEALTGEKAPGAEDGPAAANDAATAENGPTATDKPATAENGPAATNEAAPAQTETPETAEAPAA